MVIMMMVLVMMMMLMMVMALMMVLMMLVLMVRTMAMVLMVMVMVTRIDLVSSLPNQLFLQMSPWLTQPHYSELCPNAASPEKPSLNTPLEIPPSHLSVLLVI